MRRSAIERLERAIGPKGLPGVAAAAIGDDAVYEDAAGERVLGGGADEVSAILVDRLRRRFGG